MKKIIALFLAALMLLSVVGCGIVDEQLAEDIIDIAGEIADEASSEAPDEAEPAEESPDVTDAHDEEMPAIDEEGEYSSKDDVALYIHTYGHLPKNFMKKKNAQALGWEGGSLEPYAPGCAIGGDRFGNYEGLLPEGDYTECDIDTVGASSRGAKRIVFSEDAIYYTDDHYESFTQLY